MNHYQPVIKTLLTEKEIETEIDSIEMNFLGTLIEEDRHHLSDNILLPGNDLNDYHTVVGLPPQGDFVL